MDLLILSLGGLVFGLLLSFIWDFFEKRYLLQKTKSEGDIILQEAQEKSETLLDHIKSQAEQKKEQVFKKFEPEIEDKKKSIRQLQSKMDIKTYKLSLKEKEKEKKTKNIKKQLSYLQKDTSELKNQIQSTNKELKDQKESLNKKIIDHFSINTEEFKKEITQKVKKQWYDEISQKQENYEKETEKNLHKNTLYYLNLALNRFDKPYCSRRTIEPVRFSQPKIMKKVVGKDKQNIIQLEKECGVDMLVNEEDQTVQIFGIDPVRRELGRLSLIYLIRASFVNSKTIKDAVKKCKKNLFETIKQDGNSICKRLRLKQVSPEVKNMMGALQYRYSFAQNQYHHCEEVGWLCGLLNSELNLPKDDGKRAGMFHDIGKAMDHSIEGSHAVIGADFLSKSSEKKHILHAVRAHHHDETPSTPLAYLVISADAISGSRPGARRFTENTYTRKLATLERIIDSFKNIKDAYIMSAGREMRIIVDSQKVSDQDTMDLSKKIARQIERECSYPGLIKVTVVRHSEVTSMTS